MNTRHFISLIGGLAILWSPISTATIITTDIFVTGSINGQTLSGIGTSLTDTLTGISDTTIVYSFLPSDFPPIAYGKSHKTKHHKKHAVSLKGTKNFNELSPDGYSFDTLITYDNGLGSLHNTGSVIATGPTSDIYTLDIQGTYLGPLDAIGVQTQPAILRNVPGSPGDISMIDRELIQYGSGFSLGLTEIGVFSLFSGATLPFEPDYLMVDVLSFGFDSATNTLELRTQATETPEPATLIMFISGLLGIYTKTICRKRRCPDVTVHFRASSV